jgi:hypothetical protein
MFLFAAFALEKDFYVARPRLFVSHLQRSPRPGCVLMSLMATIGSTEHGTAGT